MTQTSDDIESLVTPEMRACIGSSTRPVELPEEISASDVRRFLTRTLTDWAGPRAFLRAMTVRHTASTYEGDMQRYSATIAEKSPNPENPWVVFDTDGRNQDGEQILRGRCTLVLPRRDWPIDRPTWEAGK